MKRPPKDGSGKKLVPYNPNGNVPDKPRTFLRSFRALVDQFDKQIECFNELYQKWQGRNRVNVRSYDPEEVDYARAAWMEAREGAEQCIAGLEQWSATLKEGEDIHQPSIKWLIERIATMLMTMPDAKLSSPQEYGVRLAERLDVEDASCMVWESLFQGIEDNWTKSRPPVIAEVLERVERHKKIWQRRLAAINLDQINDWGKATVFALEFKHAITKEAALEYLDTHGHAELAADVRDDGYDPFMTAIHGMARSEGLTDLETELDAAFSRYEDYAEAWHILSNRKHVVAEWDLLLLKAKRHVNRDKPFVCYRCGTGYMAEQVPWSASSNEKHRWSDDCLVCEEYSSIVDLAKWEQRAAAQQQIQEETFKDELKLWQREQKLRAMLLEDQPPQYWVRSREQRAAKLEQRHRQRQEAAEEEARLRYWEECQREEEARQRYWEEIYFSQLDEDARYTDYAIWHFERYRNPAPEEDMRKLFKPYLRSWYRQLGKKPPPELAPSPPI